MIILLNRNNHNSFRAKGDSPVGKCEKEFLWANMNRIHVGKYGKKDFTINMIKVRVDVYANVKSSCGQKYCFRFYVCFFDFVFLFVFFSCGGGGAKAMWMRGTLKRKT